MDDYISTIGKLPSPDTTTTDYTFNKPSERRVNTSTVKANELNFKPIEGRIEKTVLQEMVDKVTSYFKLTKGRNVEKIILKNVSKMIPLSGAVPSSLDAVEMFQKSMTSPSPEVRYLAKAAAMLNGADAVLSVAEFFTAEFGVPIAADMALGSAEFGLAVIIDSIETEIKNGDFEPSKELHTLIGLSAIAVPRLGVPALVQEFGVKGALEILKTTAETLLHR